MWSLMFSLSPIQFYDQDCGGCGAELLIQVKSNNKRQNNFIQNVTTSYLKHQWMTPILPNKATEQLTD